MTLSPLAADHVQRPRNRGPLEDASYGVYGVPGDGPYVEIWAKTDGGVVRQAAFRTPGCPSSTAAASMLCEVATGRAVGRVNQLTDDDLISLLGGLPEGKEQYAEMAVTAMKRALKGHE